MRLHSQQQAHIINPVGLGAIPKRSSVARVHHKRAILEEMDWGHLEAHCSEGCEGMVDLLLVWYWVVLAHPRGVGLTVLSGQGLFFPSSGLGVT